MRRNSILVMLTLAVLAYIWWHLPAPPAPRPSRSAPVKRAETTVEAGSQQAGDTVESVANRQEEQREESGEDPKPGPRVLHYKIQDGLMIVQGDVLAGAPSRPGVPPTGLVEMPVLKLWPRGVIPYHIQPDVPNPERIYQAIAMFEGTAVRFVPYNGETDALVFEVGEKNCLSYVGKMGGNQPIFLADRCMAADIAHELLHSIGFVHEQNRADRDIYINVLFDSIDDEERANFEKLSQEFMKVSGLGEFDYQSLMIYPVWMFAKNGHSTMEPKIKDKLIEPGARLSAGDIERINRAYGSRIN